MASDNFSQFSNFGEYEYKDSGISETHNGNLFMSELFPDNYDIDAETEHTKGLERFYPQLTNELKAELEAMIDLDVNSKYLVSDRRQVGLERKGKVNVHGTELKPFNMYTQSN